MGVNNPAKLYIIGLIVVCATVLFAIGRISSVTEYLAVVGPFAGYLVGNGIAAKRGDPSEPALCPK
jgi:hypothetical protein